MALLDDYFDPEQFQAGGGLLGRLLSLPQMHGLFQPDADDQAPSAPQKPLLQPMPWPNLPNYGQPSSDLRTAVPNLSSQYQALRPVLGDRNAMIAIIHPDIGKTLIAQALVNRQPRNTGGAASVDNGQAPSAWQTSDEVPGPNLINCHQVRSGPQTAAQDVPAQYAAGTAASGPYSPIPNSDQSDIQQVGISSSDSVYCRAMKRLCHSQCVP